MALQKPYILNQIDTIKSDLTDITKHKTLVFNMKENGADNTGTIVCDSIIDLAVASGLPIYFPTGVYLIGKTRKFTSDVIMFGDSQKSTILKVKSDIERISGSIEVFNFKNAILKDFRMEYRGGTNNTFATSTLGLGAGVLISSFSCDYFNMENVDTYCDDDGVNTCNVLNVNFKTQDGSCNNIRIDNCNFYCDVNSDDGGCLWLTCSDTYTRILKNINITNNYLYTAQATEVLAFYGSALSPNLQIENITIDNNTFETASASVHMSDNIFNVYGCPSRNINISNNKININFGVSTPFRFQRIMEGDLIFANNMVNISNQSTEEFLSLFLVDSAITKPISIIDNTFNINIPNYTRCENASGYNVNFANNKFYFTGGSVTKPSVRIAGYRLIDNFVSVDNTNSFAIDATIVKGNNMSVVGQAVASYFPLANTSYWYKDNYFYNIGFDFNLSACNTSSYLLFSRNEMNRNILLRGGVLNKLIFVNNVVNNVQENWVDITSANITSVATMYHFKNNIFYTNLKSFADIVNP